MDVLISGQAGVAALITGDNASLVDCDGNIKRESKYQEVARQFCLYNDTLFIKSIDRTEALYKLKFESDKSNALLVLLTILDANIPNSPKTELLKISDDLLGQVDILNYIRGVLYARPLLDNSIKDEKELGARDQSISINLITDLINSQDRIKAIYDTWQKTALSYQTQSTDLSSIEGIFVNNLIAFYLCRNEINKALIDKLRFNCLLKLSNVPNGRQIIRKLFGSYESNTVDSGNQVERFENSDINKPTKRSKSKSVKVHDVYQQVISQINNVVKLLESGDEDHALRYAKELIESQLSRMDYAYAAMSLCQLSEAAKNIGNFSLQLEWAQEATRVNPEDPRTFAHLAEAYLNLNRYDEAYQNFELTSGLGDPLFGKSGLARIERARHNYDYALELVDEAISINPEFDNLRLKAELFRDIGQFEKASELYQDLMNEYPGEPSAMCGYAAVLTDQGLFAQAEENYRSAINIYPNEQVPATSLGFLLAREGKFKEAIIYLDLGIKIKEPNDIVSQMIKAKALRIKGSYNDAKNLYCEIINSNKYLIEPWLELIEMLSTMNNIQGAKEAFENALGIFGKSAQLSLNEAIILQNDGNYAGALSILDGLKATHPKWIKVLSLRADILKTLEYLNGARDQYLEILSINKYHKRAQLGLSILNALEGQEVNIDELQKSTKEELMEARDWDKLHVNGLLLLAHNKPQEAKSALLKGYKNTPFKPIKEKFAISLAVARNTLGQHATALKTITNLKTNNALIQKIIIKGELGRTNELESDYEYLKSKLTSNYESVVNLLEAKYRLGYSNTLPAQPNLNLIMSENVKSVLLAA